MTKGKQIVSLAACAIFLQGCAGSANHEVVTAYHASDEVMSCEQLTAEQVRVQAIINQVNTDKDDVSGADVVDGILWFPFNLIAKNINYSDALNAANARIARIDGLRRDKNCSQEQYVEAEKNLEGRLQELSELYEKELITEAEYKEARQKVLFARQ